MNEIVKKINKIRDQILSEKPFGKLILFILLVKSDTAGKWDIIVSANNIKENNSKKDLELMIDYLKKEFDDLSFISQIVLLTPTEEFVRNTAMAILSADVQVDQEITNFKIDHGLTIRQMYIIYEDFEGLDFSIEENPTKKDNLPKSF